MCLAVPAKIISINGYNAEIEALGVRKNINIALIPGAKTGDYVLVHAGFAIQVIEEDEALITEGYWKDYLDEK